MNTRLQWNDFATLLLIAEAGSLAAAGRQSGQSRPTLLRRLNAIEQQLGVRLFERFRSGYVATEAGMDLLEAARKMRVLGREAEQSVGDQDLRPAGKVVLATTDTLFTSLILPELDGLHSSFPQLLLDIHVSNQVQDLFNRDADLALRPTNSPHERLVGRKLGRIQQAIFVERRFAEQNLCDIASIGPSQDMPYPELHAAMQSSRLDGNCRLRFNSILSMFQAVLQGLGAAILPVYLGRSAPQLIMLGDPIGQLDTDLWLLTDPELRRTARVRAVLDHLGRSAALRAKIQ